MGWIRDYVFGAPVAVATFTKEFIVDPLTGGKIAATARTPTAECSGWTLDPATGLELCVDDLVLDPETGELITPAEAQRRARRGLMYDREGDEWVEPAEWTRRKRERETRERRARGDEVRDRQTGEWITPDELARRRRARNALRIFMESGTRAGLSTLPRLATPAAALITIGRDGVALLGGQPATSETLGAAEDLEVADIITTRPGPERREEEKESRMRAIKYAVLALALAGGAYAIGRQN
jgi:hypothetical protein